MVITLVGLSGCGKSYFAKRLRDERGFTYIGCDDLIEAKLAAEIGGSGIAEVAAWMGEPFEARYAEREQRYLELEAEVLEEVLERLGPDGWGLGEDIVVDTTGSLVYLQPELLAGLKARSRIIYLSVPKNEYEMMYQQYFDDPKPVIWGESFQQIDGEPSEEALRRCYPKLISWRAARYQELAEMTMVMDRKNRDRLSITRFLQLAGAR